MMIKLKRKLPSELTDLGVLPNNRYHAYPSQNGNADDVEIKFIREGAPCIATIEKQYYIKD